MTRHLAESDRIPLIRTTIEGEGHEASRTAGRVPSLESPHANTSFRSERRVRGI